MCPTLRSCISELNGYFLKNSKDPERSMFKLSNEPNTIKNGQLAQKLRAIEDNYFSENSLSQHHKFISNQIGMHTVVKRASSNVIKSSSCQPGSCQHWSHPRSMSAGSGVFQGHELYSGCLHTSSYQCFFCFFHHHDGSAMKNITGFECLKSPPPDG